MRSPASAAGDDSARVGLRGGASSARVTPPTLFLLARALAAPPGDEMVPVEGSKNSSGGHVASLSVS